LILRGPSAIAFAGWLEHPPVIGGREAAVRILDSPALMQAALMRQEADIAVLPMISAANLYNKGIGYVLAGCPVWGTLYVVERGDIDGADRSLFVFGQGTTPDVLARHYLKEKGLHYVPDYSFATAGEVLQGIIGGKIKRAVISEPFLSMGLSGDTLLRVTADLNTPEGFAQAAILFAPSLADCRGELDSLFGASCRFASENPAAAIRILERHGLFPAGALTAESIGRCKIRYAPAIESEERITAFLTLIEAYEPKAIGGKLPGREFITGER
jgi:NitT/TauT family transport system substrate-binding protein